MDRNSCTGCTRPLLLDGPVPYIRKKTPLNGKDAPSFYSVSFPRRFPGPLVQWWGIGELISRVLPPGFPVLNPKYTWLPKGSQPHRKCLPYSPKRPPGTIPSAFPDTLPSALPALSQASSQHFPKHSPSTLPSILPALPPSILPALPEAFSPALPQAFSQHFPKHPPSVRWTLSAWRWKVNSYVLTTGNLKRYQHQSRFETPFS